MKTPANSNKGGSTLMVVAVNLGILVGLLGAIELGSRFLERKPSQPRHAAKGNNVAPRPWELQLPPKSNSEVRVFLFGGSTVYGVPVPEVAFVRQTEYWLRQLFPDSNIKIYNFAAPGRDTAFVRTQFIRRLADQPDLTVVITGHNEFLRPNSSASKPVVDLRGALSSHLATMRLIEGGLSHMMKYRKANVMPDQVEPWDRRSAEFERRVAAYESELKDIIATAQQRGVKLIVGTLPSNLADWPPVYQRLSNRDSRYSELVSRIQGLLREEKYREASDAISAAGSSYGEDAMLYFLRGKTQAAEGAYTDASASFIKARDLDPMPWRTPGELNSIVRRTAAGKSGVYLLDLEKVYQERAEHGLIGLDLIGDNVHGTPLGESISAQAILEVMSQIGFLPRPQKPRALCCPVARFLADTAYLQPKSPLRLQVLLEDAKYVMKTPFLNYDLSRKYLMEALSVDENSWEVWANLASVSYLTGNSAKGAAQLAKATELHHAPLDPDDRVHTPYLKEALEAVPHTNLQ